MKLPVRIQFWKMQGENKANLIRWMTVLLVTFFIQGIQHEVHGQAAGDLSDYKTSRPKPWRFKRLEAKTSGELVGLRYRVCGLVALPVIENKGGKYFGIKLTQTRLQIMPVGSCKSKQKTKISGILPDGEITHGTTHFRRVWLSGPTTRYNHGILGDSIEAGSVRVETLAGKQLEFPLPPDSVFEDRRARVVRLRMDGPEYLLVVRSHLNDGGSLALLGLAQGRLRQLAASAPFGRPYRWLNPVGVADFDGDGQREIAAVLTPHIGGTLTLYERKGGKLLPKHQASGFSNHAIGSRNLDLSAVLDANGDGVMDLAVPDNSQKVLRIVTFAAGRFREIRRVSNTARMVLGILQIKQEDGSPSALIFGLGNGVLVALLR